MKVRLHITFFLIFLCGFLKASQPLPKETTSIIRQLYVFDNGLVRAIGAIEENADIESLAGKRLFPENVCGDIIWFCESDPLPMQIPEDEQLFIRKVTVYLSELAEEENYNELNETLQKIKRFQTKNGGDALPTEFAAKTDIQYNSKGNEFALFIILVSAFSISMFCLLKKQESKTANTILTIFVILYIALNMACRWIIEKHIPLTSNYEIILFLSLCTLIINVIANKNSKTSQIINAIIAIIILAANICCDKSISALNSLLDSPLLAYHVSITIISYAIFMIMAINGIIGLVTKDTRTSDKLLHFNSIMLYPGIICLAIGIIIGSIWAKTAWGSYWSWDPKETWALITLLVYGIGIFANKSSIFLKNKNFHIFCIAAFAVVLFAYFGVNYLLTGFHSYI
ncbi:MAG: cytochrome c biogenesis protein CcsA [Bacteroidales bacterium]|nr:cytochrome c biogenesis protein CcsA [Bacteroidales bacterium]